MFSNLKSQVSIMTTVMASAMSLLSGLHEKLEQELENTRRTGDLAGVSDTVMALKYQTSQLAAAVAANTIADPNAGSIGLTQAPVGLTPAPDMPLSAGGVVGIDSGSAEGDAGNVVDSEAGAEENSAGGPASASVGSDSPTEAAVEETVAEG